MGATTRRYDGTPLIRLRERLDLTQEQLAARLSVSQAYISQVERGEREYTPDLRRRAAALVATVTLQT